jgi:predicted permease
VDGLLQDLRFAVRMIAKSPGFTLIVILTLGLGIGANTAIFTLMDQVLLRALPVKDPARLVLLDGPGPFIGRTNNDQTFSYPMYRDLRDGATALNGLLARFSTAASLSFGGQTERVTAEVVSGNYFEVLGVRPVLGRSLSPDDDRTPGGHPVVVLSHGLWTRRFGADSAILNQTVNVNGHPMTVVGVAPRGFGGFEVGSSADIFVPMMMKAQMTPTWDDLDNRRSRWVNIVGRLKDGDSREQAEGALNVVYRRLLPEDLAQMGSADERFRSRFLAKHLDVLPGYRGISGLRRDFSTPLVILMSMVGLVLLIACANVANLLVARATTRQHELAIRLAMGASRRQIVRQLVVESLLLSLMGGIAGLLFASWTGDLLLRALPFEGAARALSAAPDLRVMTFALAVSLATGVLFGLLPALQATRPSLSGTLKEESGRVVGGSSVRVRKLLVVAQVALSLLLLVGAGLFARSLYNLRHLDPGFDTESLLTFSIDPTLNGHDQPGTHALFRLIRDDLASLPQVRSVSMAANGALTGNFMIMTVKVDGYESREDEDLNPHANFVGPGYFATMETPLLEGREFTDLDEAKGAPRVAVVNETFARYFFKGRSALGHRFGFGPDKGNEIEIVGVVKDDHAVSLRDPVARWVYTPTAAGLDLDQVTFYVRGRGDERAMAAAARESVKRADAGMPVFDLKTMRVQVDESLFLDRMVAALSACFGLLATLLACVGLYGVMAFTVARRTREIGIRMALGAARVSVLWLVMREAAVLAGIGIALGLPGAWALARVVESQFFGLSAADPTTLACATAALATVTLLAGYLPARRATEVEPVQALRYE